jgi:hypothetical protein
MQYIPRWIEARLKDSFDSHPVVVLIGPRQVGKSTLLEHAEFLKDWHYITLDDDDALKQAEEDPKGLLWEDKPTIIDEVQRCPELLITVKYLVDRSRRSRNFILSGSGNLSLRKGPRETLAGRARYLHMTGFGYREIRGMPPAGLLEDIWRDQAPNESRVESEVDLADFIWRGSLPGAALASSDKIALERLGGYVDTYLQKDIQDLVRIRHPENFRRLMRALAEATGWESVQEELSKECRETRTNVSRYLSLLKETNLLYDLKGYAVKGENAYRQSKYYWFDSGSACFLAGVRRSDELKKPALKGRFFENFILQQILSWASLQLTAPEIFYWKRKAGESEVDFVIRHEGKVIGVEVKSSDNISFGDTRSIRDFLKSHPEVHRGLVVYNGPRVYPVASNIYAVPWTAL